ncbi:MAG: YiiX/YebB-like N1pC/P60 family cysteine hydrolase [Rikenellaceae bacterium]
MVSKGVVASLFICLLVGLLYCYARCKAGDEGRNVNVELRDGDIAFRCGVGARSVAVLAASEQKEYSHVGLVIMIDGEWFVVHSEPRGGGDEDKVYCDPLSTFFSSDNSLYGAICRYDDLDNLQRSIIRSYISEQLDRQALFDHDYDTSEQDRLYCSEFVWQAYLRCGIDVTEERRTKVSVLFVDDDVIMPSDIRQNSKLSTAYSFCFRNKHLY